MTLLAETAPCLDCLTQGPMLTLERAPHYLCAPNGAVYGLFQHPLWCQCRCHHPDRTA